MTPDETFGLFEADPDAIAVPSSALLQVLDDGLRCRLPGAPPMISGVVEFQRHLVPLLSLQPEMPDAPESEAASFLVAICSTRLGLVGIPVRRVRQVAALVDGNYEAEIVQDAPPWQVGTFQFQDKDYRVINFDRLMEVLPG